MASSQVELQSVLTMETGQFMKALDEAEARGKRAGKGIEQGFQGIEKGLAGIGSKFVSALSVGAVVQFGRQILQMGGELQDASDKLNMDVESLQRLEFAFGQSGVSGQDFEKGLVKLNQSLDDARDGGEKSITAFMRLGVTMKDVEDKSPEEVLYLIADGMKNTTNYTESLAAATDVLGKQGPKMAAGLRQGADAVKALGEEASVLTKQQIADIDAAGDAIDKLGNKATYAGARVVLAWKEIFEAGQGFQDSLAGLLGGDTTPLAKWLQGAGNPLGGIAEGLSGGVGGSNEDAEAMSYIPNDKGRGRKLLKEEEAIIEEMNREEKESAEFIEKDLQNKQKTYLELLQINEEIFAVNQETARQGMDSTQLIRDMEKQRVYWLQQAVKYEKDIFQLHEKDAANARLRAAKLQQQIADAKRNAPKTFEQTVFDSKGRGMMDAMKKQAGFSTFSDAGTARNSPSSRRGGSLVTGGLRSGGLIGGGLGDAYHKVRRGDAARAKAAAREAQQAKDPVQSAIAASVANLADKWGAKGVRP